MGNWITEDGHVERKLEEAEKKVKRMVKEAVRLREKRTGEMSTEITIFMYEKTIVPGILYNLMKWRKKDWQKLERIQGEALKILLKMPTSTPYWGLLGELGMWTMEGRIQYKQMMLLQNVLTSKDDRLAKKL